MSGKAAADGKAARPSVSGRKRADGGRSAGRRNSWEAPAVAAHPRARRGRAGAGNGGRLLLEPVAALRRRAGFPRILADGRCGFRGRHRRRRDPADRGRGLRLPARPRVETLSFTFGTYSGKGRYRFSLDRQTLVIQDGDFSWFSTLTDDAVWTFQALVAAVQGGEPPLPEGNDVVVLVRSAPVPPSGDAAGGSAEDPVGDAGVGDGAGSSDPSGGSGGSVAGADPAAGALLGRASCRPHGRFSGGLTWTSSGSNA